MKEVQLTEKDERDILSILDSFDYPTNKSSSTVGRDYINKMNSLSSNATEDEILKWFSFLKKELHSIDIFKYEYIINMLNALKIHYPREWFVDTFLYLLHNVLPIDSHNASLVNKRVPMISLLQKNCEGFLSEKEITEEIGIKKLFYWNWVTFLSRTDCDDRVIIEEVTRTALSQEELTADAFNSLMNISKHRKSSVVQNILDILSREPKLPSEELKRWKEILLKS